MKPQATNHYEPNRAPIAGPHPRLRGFTLLELLVVVLIIMVLVGIGVSLGPAIAGRGSEQMTRMALSVGESVLTEYHALTGRWPDVVSSDVYPLTRIGGPTGTDDLAINDRQDFERRSIERFVARTLQTTVTERDSNVLMLRRRSSINSLYEDLDRRVLLDEDDNGFLEVRDGWGEPIIYVTPGDPWADFLPYRPTPYFVSAGPSGNFGDVYAEEGTALHEASLDNIYSFEVGN